RRGGGVGARRGRRVAHRRDVAGTRSRRCRAAADGRGGGARFGRRRSWDAGAGRRGAGLLVAGIGAAGGGANGGRPFGRGRALAIPSFALGLGPSEFPLHTELFQLGVAGVLARGGALRGWPGRLGLAAHAASAVGLAVASRRAGQADAVLETALV